MEEKKKYSIYDSVSQSKKGEWRKARKSSQGGNLQLGRMARETEELQEKKKKRVQASNVPLSPGLWGEELDLKCE